MISNKSEQAALNKVLSEWLKDHGFTASYSSLPGSTILIYGEKTRTTGSLVVLDMTLVVAATWNLENGELICAADKNAEPEQRFSMANPKFLDQVTKYCKQAVESVSRPDWCTIP